MLHVKLVTDELDEKTMKNYKRPKRVSKQIRPHKNRQTALMPGDQSPG